LNFKCTSCMTCKHAAQIVKIFHILEFSLIYRTV
jgi:hypothetical protein